jgi:hypothetical protein
LEAKREKEIMDLFFDESKFIVKTRTNRALAIVNLFIKSTIKHKIGVLNMTFITRVGKMLGLRLLHKD